MIFDADSITLRQAVILSFACKVLLFFSGSGLEVKKETNRVFL